MSLFARSLRRTVPNTPRLIIAKQPVRFRSVTTKRKPPSGPPPKPRTLAPFSKPLSFSQKQSPLKLQIHPPQPFPQEQITSHLALRAQKWKRLSYVTSRFENFGIPRNQVAPSLAAYHRALQEETVLTSLNYGADDLARLSKDLAEAIENAQSIDAILSRLFYEWASSPAGEKALLATQSVTPNTIATIQRLFKVADMSDQISLFPSARSFPKRKIIMHVGPTNSGKTHNALRALAAAKTGLYGGPLRLLAHEIWERLNKGQIVPLGMDADEGAEPDLDNNIDGGTPYDIESNSNSPSAHAKPIIQKGGDPRFARVCNLVTGEEQRMLDVNTNRMSCTIEMIPYHIHFDVAVIDEIQMISDTERGGSWTNALLGLNASEVHVCGEESAVPLVKELLKGTGDDIVVNRYQRLSPLRVGTQSLGGDLTKVQKGDCVVSFSRRGIFSVKGQIERKTGIKCAVAYGRLPPEIRSEQAKLFNNPDGGYDVLVGSDAIGLGLNLKIKRIIFESVGKWDGTRERLLSISQFKQIAGRAGRFGLHNTSDSEDLGGIATTLNEEDLPILRKAMEAPIYPLTIARVRPMTPNALEILEVLPPEARKRSSVICDVYKYVSKTGPFFEMEDMTKKYEPLDMIDTVVNEKSGEGLTIADRQVLELAPVGWRDPLVAQGATKMMKEYRDNCHVTVDSATSIAGLRDHLDDISHLMEESQRAAANVDAKTVIESSQKKIPEDSLIKLESLHKLVIVYLWLSYRQVLAFSQRREAEELKTKVEKVLEWALKNVSMKKPLVFSNTKLRDTMNQGAFPQRGKPGFRPNRGPVRREDHHPGKRIDAMF